MPKKKEQVTIRFGKATATPSSRQRPFTAKVPMRTPQPRSPLHQYIADNADSGLTDQELIAQFQEYDCSHPTWEEVTTTATYIETRCTVCWKNQRKAKSNG